MIFALTLLLPLLALAVWAFWRLSPQPADPRPVLWFNGVVTVLSLAICVAVVIYVRRTMTGSTADMESESFWMTSKILW